MQSCLSWYESFRRSIREFMTDCSYSCMVLSNFWYLSRSLNSFSFLVEIWVWSVMSFTLGFFKISWTNIFKIWILSFSSLWLAIPYNSSNFTTIWSFWREFTVTICVRFLIWLYWSLIWTRTINLESEFWELGR